MTELDKLKDERIELLTARNRWMLKGYSTLKELADKLDDELANKIKEMEDA